MNFGPREVKPLKSSKMCKKGTRERDGSGVEALFPDTGSRLKVLYFLYRFHRVAYWSQTHNNPPVSSTQSADT